MDLRALADFDLVATHGGFSQASRLAGRPKATLARRVAELETTLGNPPPLPVIVHVQPKAGAVWTVREGDRDLRFSPRVVLRLSSLPMPRAAVLVGGGAALLPRSLAGQEVSAGRLVRWGVESGAPPELWALHGSRRLVDPKVTAFVQHLTAALTGKPLKGVIPT